MIQKGVLEVEFPAVKKNAWNMWTVLGLARGWQGNLLQAERHWMQQWNTECSSETLSGSVAHSTLEGIDCI